MFFADPPQDGRSPSFSLPLCLFSLFLCMFWSLLLSDFVSVSLPLCLCAHLGGCVSPASIVANDAFSPPTRQAELPHGVLNICPKAGDVVVISERLLHGALRWQPEDRDRRFLTLRYNVQHHVLSDTITPFPQEITDRLSPRTGSSAINDDCFRDRFNTI